MPRYSEATLAAIKQAVDIVGLIGESLQVTRAGSKFKTLCPFHDDHNPSLEINPDRQSYKCWSCGAGGDVFDFVKEYERVEFPEAVRMLADRAGVTLEADAPVDASSRGASKTELLAVSSWAEGAFREAFKASLPAQGYVASRGLTGASVERFKLGYAPGERGWLVSRAKRAGFTVDLLERAGLVVRPAEPPGTIRERFRGRLIFPIHDPRGRAIGFGGRVLPEVEQYLAATGKRVAKYLNSPETSLFQKRRVLYASDLARTAAREAGWVAVVEGYTDVIAAHQVDLRNVVGTLGTALGDDHMTALRRLVDRVVLILDGDDAGQNAADRSLELFLSHEVDVRVLTLPDDLDPCDYLLREGAEAFRALVATAVDPLAFALRRAEVRFDLNGLEGSRQAAEWVLNVLARVPVSHRVGLDLKVGKALDTLAHRLRLPVETLDRRLRAIRKANLSAPPRVGRPSAANAATVSPSTREPAATAGATAGSGKPETAQAPPLPPPPPVSWKASDLDATDRELVQIVLNEPGLVGRVIARVTAGSLRDAPLRALLQTAYDLHAEGVAPSFEKVATRLEEPALRAFAAGLLLPIDRAPLPEDVRPAPWEDRLRKVLANLDERGRMDHLRELKGALDETTESDDPVAYRALKTEYLRRLTQRPDTKTKTAS